MRVALATCATLPELAADDAPLVPALAERGVEAVPLVWDDPDADWGGFDLVVVRSTWDYAGQRARFLEWAERVEQVTRLANPSPVIRWNTDKHYLRELEAAGVPVVPTKWLSPDAGLTARALHTRFPADGDFVIKPAVSAGSLDSGRYTALNADSRGLAIKHALRLLRAGRTVMVQRYVRSVDTAGERAHIFVLGEYSHTVLKGAMLHGPDTGDDEGYREEHMATTTPAPEEVAAAREVVRTAGRLLTEQSDGARIDRPFLYSRVDVVTTEDDSPAVMELEMVETSLFLGMAPGSLERFADAIATRAGAS